MALYNPAVEKATRWLTEMMREKKFAQGDCLPPIRELAVACGVSTVSMNKAIAELKKSGLLLGKRGQRPVVVESEASISNSTPCDSGFAGLSQTSRTRIETEVRKKILLGVYGPGELLPPLKDLQQNFRASHRTIRSALQRLHEQGLVEAHNRWYRISQQRIQKSHARVALIGFTYGPNNAIIRAHHDDYIRSMLQTECWRRNLILEQVGCPIDSALNLYGYDSRHPYTFDGNVVACILLLNQISETWSDLFHILSKLRRPVAIIDEFSDWSMHDHFPSPGSIRAFSFSAGRKAAREITRTLIQFGHRHFAYISPYKNMKWSIVRRQGIMEELAAAGLESNLNLYEFDFKHQIPDSMAGDIHKDVLKTLSGYPAMVSAAFSHVFSPSMWGVQMQMAYVKEQLGSRLDPLCARRDITAWIAVNDETAIIAQDTLRKKGVRLPADMSLVSFDNLPATLDMRISSYDFNVPGLAALVLNFITSSCDARTTFPAERIEVPGTLIERASIGRAPVASG